MLVHRSHLDFSLDSCIFEKEPDGSEGHPEFPRGILKRPRDWNFGSWFKLDIGLCIPLRIATRICMSNTGNQKLSATACSARRKNGTDARV